ncbi:FAD:protein FMN transferase [Sphingobacterium sp. LRF_L2]|uniref:FAD:protein FMN transferase n=1 Tax=Sphingobacterium sp. LRF_L2 TaxID=3369421 RepID=UPI003F631BC5
MNKPQTAIKTYLSQTRYIFHCHIKVKIPIAFGEEVLANSFQLLETIDKQYNSYQEGSYFHQINQQAGNWVDIDGPTHDMLRTIATVSEATAGAYDISCMPLLRLWGFYRSNPDTVPDDKEIKQALAQVNFGNIRLEHTKVKILQEQELITGSFIKSFAVDKLVKYLRALGLEDFIINAGGSTISGVNDHLHPTWTVQIPDPIAKNNSANRKTVLSNQSFCLSARSINQITLGGQSYGHILNAATGYPSRTLQAGVWCDDAFTADVLSTAIFTVASDILPETIAKLEKSFTFNYFHIDAYGRHTTNLCSTYHP